MREATWSKVGKSVEGAKSIDECLKIAGLDYNVGLAPVYYGDNNVIPGTYASVRDDGHYYGVVGKNYNVVQNRDALDFVNYLKDDIQFLKAGETNSGMVYLIGKLESVNILGDEFTPHVIFRNGFNGKYNIQAAICPLRIVCQNQFNFAFKYSKNTVSIKHNGLAAVKMREAKEVLITASDYIKTLREKAERLSTMAVTAKDINRIVEDLFPIRSSDSPILTERAVKARELFMEAFNAEDNQNFKGTAWGIVNAYTDYITHRPILRQTQTAVENNFTTTAFDPKMMTLFMNAMKNSLGIIM